MPIGTYLVQVQVKGDFIPFYQYLDVNDAQVQVRLVQHQQNLFQKSDFISISTNRSLTQTLQRLMP